MALRTKKLLVFISSMFNSQNLHGRRREATPLGYPLASHTVLSHTHTHTYTHTHSYTHKCTHTHSHTCTNTLTHTHTNKCIHSYTHTYTHVCMFKKNKKKKVLMAWARGRMTAHKPRVQSGGFSIQRPLQKPFAHLLLKPSSQCSLTVC